MSLEEYTRKRNFGKTPEPPADSKVSKSAKSRNARLPSFYVQRHDATRLHYDFRLEMAGVLKSWAIPKGPSLDPAQKRYAVHVEDHPLDYGSFEGNIPEGNYGAGSVMLWDRGKFEILGDVPGEQQLERGDLKIRLKGEKLKGDFALVHMKGRGKGNEWLLIKKRDGHQAPDWDIEEHAWSVLSGRTQEEIAQGLPARKIKRKTAGKPDRTWVSKAAASPPVSKRSAPQSGTPAKKKLRSTRPS